MEVFSKILLRITGLPLSHLMETNWSGEMLWQLLLELILSIEESREKIVTQIDAVIDLPLAPKDKNSLFNLRKDLRSRKKIKTNKFQSLLSQSSVGEILLSNLVQLEKDEATYQRQLREWYSWYATHLISEREKFKKLTREDNFLNALPLSSLSMYTRYQSFWRKPIADHRKKERQTERTLLQFLSRVATKTSPFSSFTTLSMATTKKEKLDVEATSAIRLNNYILWYFQNKLEANPGFFYQLKLNVNPSAHKEQGDWRFLFNSGNIESLQSIAANDLIDWVLASIEQKPMTFDQWLSEASQQVDAEVEELEAYLLQLINLGLVEWEWGISGSEVHWLEKLIALVDAKATFKEQNEILDLLSDLQIQIERIKQGAPATRVEVLKYTEQRLKSFFENPQREQPNEESDTEVFQKVLQRNFNFKAEKIFYEDQSSVTELRLSEEMLRPGLDKITKLVEAIQPIALSDFSAELWSHFDKFFDDRQEVSLLQLYASFYKNRTGEKYTDKSKEEEIEQVLTQLQQYIPQGFQKNVHLSMRECLQSLAPLTKETVGPPMGPGAAAMLHFGKSKTEGTQVYVEANFMGYGKMMGRFLHLFPEAWTQELVEWNRTMQKDELWIENVDGSYFNANLHPKLLEFQVASPGGQTTFESDQLISISDLEVVRGDQFLELKHRPTQKTVRVFNLGFEALESRSPMYQLLQVFAYQVPSLDLFTQLLDTKMIQYLKKGVIRLPRLVIDQHLILKRCRWFFPKNVLPSLGKNKDADAAFYLAVQQWRKQWDLPTEVFITLSPQMIPGQTPSTNRGDQAVSADDRKPQYVHLDNPLLIQLLGRLFRRAGECILVEEMWPASHQAIDPHGHGIEALVEWKWSKE